MSELHPRITGVEMEFSPVIEDKDGNLTQVDKLAVEACLAAYAKEHRLSPASSTNYFMKNGARIYIDSGTKLEVTTPEDTSFADTAANIRAGWRIARDVMLHYENVNPASPVRMFQRVVDDNGITSGYHENFLTQRRNGESFDLFGAVALEKATGNIFSGSGYLTMDGRFVLGQKTSDLRSVFKGGMTRGKGLIRTHDQALADPHRFQRLSIVGGDATMSPWATRMALGRSSLALRLDEHEVDISAHMPRDLLGAMRQTGNAQGGLSFQMLKGGRSMAWEVQTSLANACEELSREVSLPTEEEWTLEEWKRALVDFQQDPFLLKNRVDWVMKAIILRHHHEIHGSSWSSKTMRGIDREWHNIAAEDTIASKLEQRLWADYMPDEALIKERQFTPPDTTRAAIRGKVVAAFGADVYASWQSVSFNQRRHQIELPDPTESSKPEIDELVNERLATNNAGV